MHQWAILLHGLKVLRQRNTILTLSNKRRYGTVIMVTSASGNVTRFIELESYSNLKRYFTSTMQAHDEL